jgi:hypothetical protein
VVLYHTGLIRDFYYPCRRGVESELERADPLLPRYSYMIEFQSHKPEMKSPIAQKIKKMDFINKDQEYIMDSQRSSWRGNSHGDRRAPPKVQPSHPLPTLLRRSPPPSLLSPPPPDPARSLSKQIRSTSSQQAAIFAPEPPFVKQLRHLTSVDPRSFLEHPFL